MPPAAFLEQGKNRSPKGQHRSGLHASSTPVPCQFASCPCQVGSRAQFQQFSRNGLTSQMWAPPPRVRVLRVWYSLPMVSYLSWGPVSIMKRQTTTFFRRLLLLIPAALLLAVLACNNEGEPTPLPPPTPNIPATVQAQVTSYVDSLPAATPWPTHTPYPTGTPYPTHTPYPTATALPTHTPYPTPTPGPTQELIQAPIQAPTAAPLPTYTPYPTYTPAPATPVRVTWPTQAPAAPTEVPLPSIENYAALDNTDRVDQLLRSHIYNTYNCELVAELSMELSRQQDAAILKVYELRPVVSNSRLVQCVGTAKWSQGDNTRITIFVENDGDGDNFYGYSFRPPATR